MDSKFHLKVASREGIVFDGDVVSVSSFNEKGKFDILSNHAHFISLIKKNITIREAATAKEKVLSLDNALLRVKDNQVEVYIGIESGQAANIY